VVADAVATVTGRHLTGRWPTDPAPGWTWLNTLAHAETAHLSALADDLAAAQRSGWDGAMMFLANEVVSMAADSEELIALQRRVLIPLELDVLGGAVPAPASPAALVALVRARLDGARRRPDHLTGAP